MPMRVRLCVDVQKMFVDVCVCVAGRENGCWKDEVPASGLWFERGQSSLETGRGERGEGTEDTYGRVKAKAKVRYSGVTLGRH